MAYVVEARLVGRGVSEVACKESRIAFDSSPAQGVTLPGPAELLGAAFAACLLKNIERFSEILPFRQSGASLRVEARAPGGAPGVHPHPLRAARDDRRGRAPCR